MQNIACIVHWRHCFKNCFSSKLHTALITVLCSSFLCLCCCANCARKQKIHLNYCRMMFLLKKIAVLFVWMEKNYQIAEYSFAKEMRNYVQNLTHWRTCYSMTLIIMHSFLPYCMNRMHNAKWAPNPILSHCQKNSDFTIPIRCIHVCVCNRVPKND